MDAMLIPGPSSIVRPLRVLHVINSTEAGGAERMLCEVSRCIVTDVGDSSFIVGGTGVIVSPRHPLRLAEGILRLIRMPIQQRRQLGSQARQRIVEHFGIAKVADRYAELWMQVAGRAADSERGQQAYRPRAAA